MPELDKSNIQDAIYTKFVRSVKRIFFSDDIEKDDHSSIANRYIKDGESVDDAGFLYPDEKNLGKLTAVSGSSTLRISVDNAGRVETNEILSNL